jgi:hypothetical protein
MTNSLKNLRNKHGELLFNHSHTLMMIASMRAIAKFVDNADNFNK